MQHLDVSMGRRINVDEQPVIQIEVNGPYIVSGAVPITEMAPVHTLNGEPVDWHILRDIESDESPAYLCRCGGSSNKPFCDSSHETNGFVGRERADRRPFAERAVVNEGPDAQLLDDKPLCLQAGFCHTRTTSVWDQLALGGDPEAADRLREMTWNCPSGRLVLRDLEGNEIEPELPPEVGVVPGGPLWIRGGIRVIGSDGTEWETRNRVALCRCGGSARKPFCDGAHLRRHFDER
jgi:CDGSH-type Zn-finger protein